MLASFVVLAIVLEGINSQTFSKLTDLAYFHHASPNSHGNQLEAEYGKPISGTFHIYLMRFYYVDHILMSTERDDPVLINLEIKGAEKSVNKSCSKKSPNEFECKTCTQNIAIDGIVSKLLKLELYGYDVNLYKYLGCFSNSFFVDLKHSDKFDDCESSCGETKLYGLTSKEKCICIASLRRSSSPLDQCNVECPSKRYIFCGGINHTSVYSKAEIRSLISNPSSETLNNCKKNKPSSCPSCEDGRKTEFCSVLDCTVNNGSCESDKCEFLTLGEDLKLGVCLCQTGYFINETGSCLDVDECSGTVSPCEDTACLNTDGSYICDCKPGFKRLDDKHCGDFNECMNRTICDVESATCKNLYGTYECACKKGFVKTKIDMRTCRVETSLDRYAEAVFDLMLLLVAFILILMSTFFISIFITVSTKT